MTGTWYLNELYVPLPSNLENWTCQGQQILMGFEFGYFIENWFSNGEIVSSNFGYPAIPNKSLLLQENGPSTGIMFSNDECLITFQGGYTQSVFANLYSRSLTAPAECVQEFELIVGENPNAFGSSWGYLVLDNIECPTFQEEDIEEVQSYEEGQTVLSGI